MGGFVSRTPVGHDRARAVIVGCSYRIPPFHPLPTGVTEHDQAMCEAIVVSDHVGTCTWCSTGGHCTADACMAHHDGSTCPTNGGGCYWSSERGMCVVDVCINVADEATCWTTIGSDSATCNWDPAQSNDPAVSCMTYS